MKTFNSFLKTVGGNEGGKCHYPTRLDTYGCGCFHDCKYCYAKSLLSFRNLWDAGDPSIAPIDKIKRAISKMQSGDVVRLGGMTDCFQPVEKVYKNTEQAIHALNAKGVHYLIVTKSHIVADDEYMDILDKRLAHVQISVTSTDVEISRKYERASSPEDRIKAIEKLQRNGFDVQLRLSPYIPQFINLDVINNVECDKVLVEFLRVNTWIKKWFDIDYTPFTVKQGGYQHMPLERKIELISKITGYKEVSVCEDENEAYEYWQKNVNHNPADCCNLRIENNKYAFVPTFEQKEKQPTLF